MKITAIVKIQKDVHLLFGSAHLISKSGLGYKTFAIKC